MPQIDDYIIDVLMRDLVGHDRRTVSFLVYLWFAAEKHVVAMWLKSAIKNLQKRSESRKAQRRLLLAG
jgi:hypothetical protein